MALTRLAHQIIKQHFVGLDKPNPRAVDATCGNGHDTLFLCRLGFDVIGFDIQDTAIENTRNRLIEQNLDATLIKDSHANMLDQISEPLDLVVFNLGYLPHADKQITTLTESTLNALNASLGLLDHNGLISLMCYPGHQEGSEELLAIKHWLNELPSGFVFQLHESATPAPHAPVLYTINKL